MLTHNELQLQKKYFLLLADSNNKILIFTDCTGFHGYQQKMEMKNFLPLIQKKEKIRTFATVFEPW